jgi:hypothetical protein
VCIYRIKNFPGASPGPPFKGQGREGRERKGKTGERRKGEGMGLEGKGEEHPQNKILRLEHCPAADNRNIFGAAEDH